MVYTFMTAHEKQADSKYIFCHIDLSNLDLPKDTLKVKL